MQWGVDPAQFTRRIGWYQRSDPIQIARHQLLSEDRVGLRAWHVVQAVLGDLFDPGGDVASAGGMICEPSPRKTL